jgi:histone H2A
MCPAHNIKASNVINVHCPVYDSQSEEDSSESLTKAIKNVLTLADDKNLKTVAIPSIGTGE